MSIVFHSQKVIVFLDFIVQFETKILIKIILLQIYNIKLYKLDILV